jgi:hypothetical protein
MFFFFFFKFNFPIFIFVAFVSFHIGFCLGSDLYDDDDDYLEIHCFSC